MYSAAAINRDRPSLGEVVYSFSAERYDEITLQKGQLVKIYKEIDRHWMSGCLFPTYDSAKEGTFPSRCVIRWEAPSGCELERNEHLAVATSSYSAVEPGDLTFFEGDILVLIRGSNEHWCQGRVANDVRRKDGFVPLSYVELVDPKRWESSTSRDPSSSGHSSNSGSSSDKVLRSGVVLFDIVGQVECELTLKQGDVVVIHEAIPPDGFWLRGECNGRMGMLPSTVIEFISQPSPKESMSSLNDTDIVHDVLTNGNQAFTLANQASSSDIFSSSSSVQPVMESTDDGQTNLDCLDNPESSMVQEESTPSCSTPPLPPLPLSPVPPLERAKVLFTFMAEMPGEISLKRGEIVEVTRSNSDDHQDGWVWVRLADGRTGMAPKNFLELTRTFSVLFDLTAECPGDLSLHKDELIRLIADVDAGWILGENQRGRRGLCPRTYLKAMDAEEVPDVLSVEETVASKPLPPPPFRDSLMDEPSIEDKPLPPSPLKTLAPLEGSPPHLAPPEGSPPHLPPRDYLESQSITDYLNLATSNQGEEQVNPPPLPLTPDYSPEEDAGAYYGNVPPQRTEETVPPRPLALQNSTSELLIDFSDDLRSTSPLLGAGDPSEPPRIPTQAPSSEGERPLEEEDQTTPPQGLAPRRTPTPARRTSLGTRTPSPRPSSNVHQDTWLSSGEPSPAGAPAEEGPDYKQLRMREKSIEELFQTEREYVRHLSAAYDAFHVDDPSFLQQKGIDGQLLFRNMKELIHCSETLIESLRNARKEAEATGKPGQEMIGDCFNNATFHEMKRVYSTYCLKQEEALDLLANYHRDVEIVAYFRSVLDELKSHDVVLFDLAALLHWPVKRVLSYHLLLTEIKKSTPEGHRDLFGVSVACGEMHEVSAALNEVKRRKDMIAKYCKERRERSFRDRMSKVSIHSIEKKKSRLSQKMMTTVGWTDTTTDPLFESAQKNLHSLRDTLLYLIDHLPRSHDQLRHILKAQFAEAEHWIALYAERGRQPEVDRYRTAHHEIILLWEDYDSIFQQRILAPLKMLQSSLEDPLYLVLKRDDKRLDYDHVSKKMNSLRDHSKTRQIAEEYESTKLDFEALNKQLIEDIPKICSVSGKILDQVLGLLVESRKVFYSKILISLLPLADLPLIRSEHDSILTGFTLKHNLATNHLATLAPSLVPPTWRKKRSCSDAAPVAPVSPVVNRGLLRRSTRSNRTQLSAGDSSPKVNARRISHPPMSTTTQPRSSSPFPANMGEPYVVIRTVDPPEDKGAMGSLELPVTQGQSVRVIKKEDPCGNPDRWLIHDGVQMGFVSRDILTPAPSPGSGITPTSTVSSSTVPPAIPSRPAPQPRLSKQISGGESAPPPSYDEIMGADDAHEATAQTPTDSARAAGGSEDTSRQTERVHLLALFSYEAKTDHELSLEEGEALRVIRRGDDTGNTEWTMVEREREPRDKGFVPSSYLGTEADFE